jgi:hypothetical protein
MYVATVALVGVGTLAAAGDVSAQPVPPAPPPPPGPPPAGAPYVPLIPGDEVMQQPGQMIGDLMNMGSLDLNTLFPPPAAPPTPVREMPMGPPPPPDPRFFPQPPA